MRKVIGGGVALAALLLTAPVAFASTQTAQSGIVSATFSYSGKVPNYSHETLTIRRSGAVVYSRPVTYKPLCGVGACWPASTSASSPSVHVLDLEHNGQPDVVLDLFTGGAHCCSIEEVFSYDPSTMTYVVTSRDFGDPGETIKDLGHNGQLEFVTADDSFAYAFSAFAGSGMPIQILTFSGRRFHDVTNSYPQLITKDAAMYLRLYKRYIKVGAEGLIAAWAADEYRLGHSKQVASYLSREAKAGHLKGNGYPGGEKFVAALQKFLRKHGYLK